jgi:PilZ domain
VFTAGSFNANERFSGSLPQGEIKRRRRHCPKVFTEESKVADSPADMNAMEGRRSPRARTFLQARVSYRDGAISTTCTVNQLSDVGARITIAGAFSLPDTFEIAIPQRGISRRARLIWRKDDQAGIDFLGGEESERNSQTGGQSARIKALEAENAKLKAQIGLLMQQVHRLTEE